MSLLLFFFFLFFLFFLLPIKFEFVHLRCKGLRYAIIALSVHLEKETARMSVSIEVKHVGQLFGLQARRSLKLDDHLHLEVAPAYTGQKERRLGYFDHGLGERWV